MIDSIYLLNVFIEILTYITFLMLFFVIFEGNNYGIFPEEINLFRRGNNSFIKHHDAPKLVLL